MNVATVTDRVDAKRSQRKRSPSRRKEHAVQGGSSQAKRIVVAILEVLAGIRSVAEAASAVNISLARYYVLETQALEGMVAACEPKPLGKQPSPQTRIASLEKELQQARRECARQQALVRAAQRSVGLSASDAQKGKALANRDRQGRKKRRPTVRALKAANTLRKEIAGTPAPEVPQEPGPPASNAGKRAVGTVGTCRKGLESQ
jgi:hypothetical protein